MLSGRSYVKAWVSVLLNTCHRFPYFSRLKLRFYRPIPAIPCLSFTSQLSIWVSIWVSTWVSIELLNIWNFQMNWKTGWHGARKLGCDTRCDSTDPPFVAASIAIVALNENQYRVSISILCKANIRQHQQSEYRGESLERVLLRAAMRPSVVVEVLLDHTTTSIILDFALVAFTIHVATSVRPTSAQKKTKLLLLESDVTDNTID